MPQSNDLGLIPLDSNPTIPADNPLGLIPLARTDNTPPINNSAIKTAIDTLNPFNVPHEITQGAEKLGGNIESSLVKHGVNPYVAGIPAAIPGTVSQFVEDSVPHSLTQAVVYGLTDGLARAVEPLGEIAVSKMPQIVQDAIKVAKERDLMLLPSEIRQSPTYARIEKLGESVPIAGGMFKKWKEARTNNLIEARNNLLNSASSQPVTDYVSGDLTQQKITPYLDKIDQSRRDALKSLRDKVVQKGGPVLDTLPTGMALKVAQDAESKIKRDAATALFTDAEKSLPTQDNAIDAGLLQSTAQGLLDKNYKIASTFQDSKVISLLNQLKDGPSANILSEDGATPIENALTQTSPTQGSYGVIPPNPQEVQSQADLLKKRTHYTYQELQALRSGLGSEIRKRMIESSTPLNPAGTATPEVRMLQMIKDATQKSMDDFATQKGGDFKTKYDIAGAAWKSFKDVHNSKAIRQMISTNPEQVASLFIKPNNSTNLDLLRKAVGEPAFQTLRQRFKGDLLGESGDEVPDVSKIMNNLSKYKNSLSVLLSPSEQKQMGEFTDTLKTPQFIASGVENRLRSILKQTPDKVTKAIISGSPEIAKLTRNIVGEKDFGRIKRKVMENIIGESFNQTGEEQGLRTFQQMSNKMVNTLNGAYQPEFLKEVFSPEELKGMNDLRSQKYLTETGNRLAGNPSGTGQAMITAGDAFAVVTNPINGAKLLIAPPVLASLYLSSSGRRLLSEGMNPAMVKNIGTFTRLAGFVGVAIKNLIDDRAKERATQ